MLFSKKILSSQFKIVQLKKFLKLKPQYGANESGVIRNSLSEPRYIRITDIDEFGLLNDSIGVSASRIEDKYVLNDKDILFARSGATVGKAYLHNANLQGYKCFFAGYMIRFVINSELVLPEYVFYYTQLPTYANWVRYIQRAAGQPNINAEEYKSLLVPFPPKVVQQEVVNIYNAAYKQKQAKEAEAKELLASIDDYLLAELGITLPEQDNSLQKRIFITNFSKLTGSRFDAYFYQEKFEYIYSVLSNGIFPCSTLLKESKLITSGATPLSGGDAYVLSGNGIPFIRSGEISNISFNECIYIKPEIHNTMLKSSRLKPGDLLIAIVGATIGEIGVYCSEREANINQAIALVRFKESINSTFIMEFIRSSFGQFILDRMKRPVARANINLDEIGTLPIPLPPLEKQYEIAEHIRKIRQKAKQLQQDGACILADAKIRVEQMILG
ncbi:MAG: restriction endonuclease subunit S [Burkholderiales bacterium]|nr:restriction endonuclease subunit S [Burkholderiales bacterium]